MQIVFRVNPVCDFCSSPEIVVAYMVENFNLPQYGWGSDGPFAACSVCMKLIETGQSELLEQRSVTTFIQQYGRLIPAELMQPFVHDLHVEFWKRLKSKTGGRQWVM